MLPHCNLVAGGAIAATGLNTEHHKLLAMQKSRAALTYLVCELHFAQEQAMIKTSSRAIAAVAAAEEVPLLRAEQRDPDYLMDVYRAQIARVEAELANFADEARRTTIAAPVSGTVLRVPEASACEVGRSVN
ncbi:MAG: hypothetical protein AAFR31_16590 [Cyanobacteria bacterium J06627_8]